MEALDIAPEILLHILADDFALCRDEVGNIEESFASFGVVVGEAGAVVRAVSVQFDNGARDDADVAFFGQGAVLVEPDLPIRADGFEFGVVRDPVREVVLREHD